MSLTPSPTACRWETFESHHSLKHGKPVQPFVRSLRIVVSGSIRHVPFYSRPLLPTAALGGCPVACPLPLRLPKRNHAVVVVAFAVGYTRLGGRSNSAPSIRSFAGIPLLLWTTRCSLYTTRRRLAIASHSCLSLGILIYCPAPLPPPAPLPYRQQW